jgi:hypothetical protein
VGGRWLPSRLYLFMTLTWIFTFAMVGAWFRKLVTAIMRVFPIAPAACWPSPDLGYPRPRAIPAAGSTRDAEPVPRRACGRS